MTFDRKPWKSGFYIAERLSWTCPACGGARLAIRPATFHDGSTGDSKEAQKSLAAEPEWIDGRFSCLMSCSHCDGEIAVSGHYKVVDNRHYDPETGENGDYDKYYTPEYFSDAPHIIRVPTEAPDEVKTQLLKAFQFYWLDNEACANRIRASIEKLLTAQRIPQTIARSSNGTRPGGKLRTLHSRLELFRGRNPQIADSLIAVKWIGNAGSHGKALTPDDLLDGFELMEHALSALYVQAERRIGALTRSINRRKGPRSKRRVP